MDEIPRSDIGPSGPHPQEEETRKDEEATTATSDFLPPEGSASVDENEEEEEKEKEGDGLCGGDPRGAPNGGTPFLWTQILSASAVAMTSFAAGCCYVYSGVTLPELMNTNSTDIVLDETNAALFSGLVGIGLLFGSLCGGMLIVRLGQRVVMLIALPFALLSWITIAVTPSAFFLYGARVLQGITLGMANLAGHHYVTEFANLEYRGRLGGYVDLARGVGVLFTFIVGAVLSWRQLALVCGIVTIVPSFLILLFLPDSPRWLASRKRFQKAEKSLRFFRGRTFDTTAEMNDIRKSADHVKKKATVMTQMKQLRDCTLLKHFLVFTFFMLAFPFAGHMIVMNYTVTIFEYTESGINAYMSAIFVGVARLSGSIIHFLIVDKLGRRVIILCSTLMCGFAMAGISAYFYIKTEMENKDLLFKIRFLPLVSLIVFMFSSSSSLQTILLLSRELLPLAFRAMGVGILSFALGLSIFLSIQAFPTMNGLLGLYGSFLTNAAFAMVLAFIPMIFLPETKGMSLEKIEENLRKKNASADKSS